jgi:hypothetical protein
MSISHDTENRNLLISFFLKKKLLIYMGALLMMFCGTLLSINNKTILFLSNSTSITSGRCVCVDM